MKSSPWGISLPRPSNKRSYCTEPAKMSFVQRSFTWNVTEFRILLHWLGLSLARRLEASRHWSGAFNTNMLLIIRNNHSFFLWLTTTSSLWYNPRKQSSIIRVMALHLETFITICLFTTSQISLSLVTATSIIVIRTVTTKAKTVQRGRDSMVVQQIHIYSRQ